MTDRGIICEETIGPCRLILGDATSVVATLEVGSVDCIVTSPPYNQMAIVPEKASGSWADSHGGAGFVRRWNEMGYADEMDETMYQRWQNALFAIAAHSSSERASLFYNHQCRWRDGKILHPVLWFRPEGWELREEIIWDRGGGMMSNAKMFCRFDERILWFDRGRHTWNQESTGHGTIWRIARMQQQQGKLHPVQFPEEIPLRCLQATTAIGGLVLDPFMGSATTGAACVTAERKFVGIEKEEKYFDIAVRRIRRAWQAKQSEIKFAPEPKSVQLSLIDETNP